jgi:ribonuclease E
MATTGLVNLAESLLNQTTTAQELQALPATNGTGTATAGAVNTQAILDEFVPSSQTGAANATAEAAGLFTAAQIPLFTAAANSLLAQSTPAQTNLAVAPGNTVAPLVPPLVSLVEGTAQTPIQTITTTPAPAAAAPAAATLAVAVAGVQTGTNGNVTAANVAPAETTQQLAAAASATNSASAIGAATAASAGTLVSQAQLQTLNNSLAALGLSTAAIQTVDQVANAINDFNPDAYSRLVYQLEAAAQAAASQTPASNVAATSTPTAATQAPATNVGAVNGPADAGVNTNGGTFALPGV